MAWLSEVGGSRRDYVLDPDRPLRVGRAEDNDVVLPEDLKASRYHAELVWREGAWWLRDLQSRNGSWVNAGRVADAELSDADRIGIGGSRFVFRGGDDPHATVGESVRSGAALSGREREILAWVAAGATDAQIARTLGIALSAVHSHLDRIRDKSGRRRRPDLIGLARELGLEIPAQP